MSAPGGSPLRLPNMVPAHLMGAQIKDMGRLSAPKIWCAWWVLNKLRECEPIALKSDSKRHAHHSIP